MILRIGINVCNANIKECVVSISPDASGSCLWSCFITNETINVFPIYGLKVRLNFNINVTCFIRFASKSLLCLVTTNPPWKLWVKTCLSLTIILFLRLNKATSLYIVYTEKNLELIMSFFNFNILPPLTYQPYLNHNLLLYSPSTAAFLVDLISNLCSLSASTSSSLTSSFSLSADSFYL